jgi:hypothetical protein
MLALSVATLLRAADTPQGSDVTGKWKSEFDTQIGHLSYVYDLKQDGAKVTGKSIRSLNDTTTNIDIVEGKINGNAISFVEPLKIPDQDQEIRIEYSGTVTNDEMKLTRKVGDFATTEIVAKRAKERIRQRNRQTKIRLRTQGGRRQIDRPREG